MSMWIQRTFRPIIRKLVPRSWQYAFSGWVYSKHSGPTAWPIVGNLGVTGTVCHRLYWVFNPRGE
jgi:hypothetical protein